MKVKEAYSILELDETATPEEAKKQFRKMSKKLHPDNKESGDEAQFKKINEAYQVVSSGKSTDREDLHWNQGAQYHHPMGNPFGRSKIFFHTEVVTKTTISFAESVLGCQREIKITRQVKCETCGGEGVVAMNNGCDTCGGRGKVVNRQGYMVMVQTCNKCMGRASTEACKDCQTKGIVEAESNIQVNIPGGVVNGNILILRNMGNFGGSFGPLDQYSDAKLHITVVPEPGLSLEGPDVVCICEIELKEALEGCSKIVNTIQGYKDVVVPSLSRHKDEIVMPKMGVNKVGNQRVILDVKYPKDVSKLINVLDYKVN